LLSIISSIGGLFASCSLVSAICLCGHGLFEAPKQSRGAGLACGVVGADARVRGADTPRHHVPDRTFAPVTSDREFLRVYGPWRSWLWQAPVCCACGDRRRRESSGSSTDSAPPCARHGWPDCGPVDCPARALCRHSSGWRDSALTRRHNVCPSAIDSYRGLLRRGWCGASGLGSPALG
jgi:hypothetical protein